MIVTYGGHGGDKCADQLKVVLGGGLKMKVVEPVVKLTFGSRDVTMRATKGEEMGLKLRAIGNKLSERTTGDGSQQRTEDEQGLWDDRRGEIAQAWEGLVRALIEVEK